MGCTASRAPGTLEGEQRQSQKTRRPEVKFVPPRASELYVRPEEHKKPSGEKSTSVDDNSEWKGLWRPSSIDEAGSLLVRQLRLQDHCCGYESGAMLDVLCTAFQSRSACVALMEQPQKVLVWSGRGLCEAGTHALWMMDFLQCCLRSPNNEVIIVEDAHRDARVKDSEAVAGDMGISSFVGAPLVAANGVRIGALCVFRGEPGRYDAVPVALLAGLAELTMRQLESHWACSHSSPRTLQRPPAAYEAATMLVDASQHAWKVLYINSQASRVTGVSLNMAGASTFWGLFLSADLPGEHPWVACTDLTQNGCDFTLRNVQRRGSSNHAVFSLTFTPVTRVMDEATIPIGVPCAAEAQVGSRQFFFVRIAVQNEQQPEAKTPQQIVPIPGLELGTLMAVSPYGKTYRGFYRDQPVAVKIVANGRRNVRYRDGRPLAIAVTEGLREQCVPLVRTFQFANHCPRTCSGHLGKPEQAHRAPECEVCGSQEAAACACGTAEDDRRSLCQMSDSACSLTAEGDFSTATPETWLVQEYCSLGTLQLAIAQGKFQRSNGRACSAAILDMACDVANGMHLLHYQGVTHGNLSSASILLTPSSSRQSCPFRAKISDYGILRELDTRGFGTPQCYPSLSHLAPEVLLQGKISKAADVYAFGVLLWELAAGQRMFAGMPWAQVMAAITLRHMRPRLPPGRAMPSGLESIVRMCLSADASDRPCFAELTTIIRAVRTANCQKAKQSADGGHRHSMAMGDRDLPRHKRSSSSFTGDNEPQAHPQEAAEVVPKDTKSAAVQLWGGDACRARSVKPGAVNEWQRISALAAPKDLPKDLPFGSGGCPEPCPKAASKSPPKPEKAHSPPNSLTKARAANMRLSVEMRRAGHGRSCRSKTPALPAIGQQPGEMGSALPPSSLYLPSRPHSNASSGEDRSRSSSPEDPKARTRSVSAQNLGPGAPTDDRLDLNEVARQRSSFGGSMGGSMDAQSSCHSESGYTHTAAHLSFTELKHHKQKNLAAGLMALRDSLLPKHERRITGDSAGDVEFGSPRDFVSLEQSKYIPSGSLEKFSGALPMIRISTDYRL